jgi:hypothetical protein
MGRSIQKKGEVELQSKIVESSTSFPRINNMPGLALENGLTHQTCLPFHLLAFTNPRPTIPAPEWTESPAVRLVMMISEGQSRASRTRVSNS